MNEVNINILFLAAAAAAVFKMIDGYKKGMVKEIISLISMIVLSVVAALAAYGVSSYHDGKVFNVIVVGVLLILLIMAHHMLGLVFFSAKLIARLPVVHFVNKLFGLVFGVFEIVLLLWTVYAFVMMMDMGAIGQLILSYTEDSPVLLWIYRNNYLAHWIEKFLEEFSFVPLA